jgi:hypothetical protein
MFTLGNNSSGHVTVIRKHYNKTVAGNITVIKEITETVVC